MKRMVKKSKNSKGYKIGFWIVLSLLILSIISIIILGILLNYYDAQRYEAEFKNYQCEERYNNCVRITEAWAGNYTILKERYSDCVEALSQYEQEAIMSGFIDILSYLI